MNDSTPKPQLLVVDDDYEITNVLKELLVDFHYEVDVAYDGLQALGKIKAKTYDAILCDYMMPVMNGQVLYETLQQSHPEVTSRFIFITGNARTPEVASFFHTFRIPYLDKPFRVTEVLQLVDKVLQTSRN
ncbi:MAG: response regulator [Verrucomicrobiae bacterium]|nr:response regulator [Verrucomicrobiae bacterium]